MLKISGLGVAKVLQIHDTLEISTPAELEEAARDGRLAKLPRFGPKMAEKILRGVEFLRESDEQKLYGQAKRDADRFLQTLLETQRGGGGVRGREYSPVSESSFGISTWSWPSINRSLPWPIS